MDITPGQVALVINEALAAEIRAERAALDLTIAQLSDKSGIANRTLVRLLAAERDIDAEQIMRVAGALGITGEELMQRAEKRARTLVAVRGLSEDDARSNYSTAASSQDSDDPTDDATRDDEQV